MNKTIKFPTKKYLNAKEYFIKYININVFHSNPFI